MSAANKFTICQYVIEKCPFGDPALANTCVQNFCYGEPYGFGSCGVDITGTPANCCSESDPASCIAAFQHTQGYANSNDACVQLEYLDYACVQANPGFGKFSYAQQAECLCYDDNGNYDPSQWDGPAASCVATGAQAHPTIYSILTANNGAAEGLCTKFAGAAASSAVGSAAASSTPTAGTLTTLPGAEPSSSFAAVSSSAAVSSNAAASTSSVQVAISTSTAKSSVAGVTTSSTPVTTHAVSTTTTPPASSTSTAAKTGAANKGMRSTEMRWLIAGVGLLMPCLIIGAL